MKVSLVKSKSVSYNQQGSIYAHEGVMDWIKDGLADGGLDVVDARVLDTNIKIEITAPVSFTHPETFVASPDSTYTQSQIGPVRISTTEPVSTNSSVPPPPIDAPGAKGMMPGEVNTGRSGASRGGTVSTISDSIG